MMLPVWAFFGTVTSSPPGVLRRCAAGETLEMRARGLPGKAIASPAAMPLPVISRLPWRETWCGLALQWLTGTHRTLMIRTLVTCGLEVGLPVPPVLRAGVVPGAPPGALAPPGLAAAARAVGLPGRPSALSENAHSSAPAAAVIALDRLWAPALVIQLQSRLGSGTDSSRYALANRSAGRKLRLLDEPPGGGCALAPRGADAHRALTGSHRDQSVLTGFRRDHRLSEGPGRRGSAGVRPSESPAPTAPGRAGWRAGPREARAG